jgi:hypothetical protein
VLQISTKRTVELVNLGSVPVEWNIQTVKAASYGIKPAKGTLLPASKIEMLAALLLLLLLLPTSLFRCVFVFSSRLMSLYQSTEGKKRDHLLLTMLLLFQSHHIGPGPWYYRIKGRTVFGFGPRC